MAITAVYAGFFGLFYLLLTIRVILYRRGNRISIGSGGDGVLAHRVRAHGNFAEYVPIALLLMALAEQGGTAAWLIHLLGVMLGVGRIAHALAFRTVPMNLMLRSIGMALTIVTLAFASVLLLWTGV